MISNVEIYGLDESIKAGKYPMSTDTESLDKSITPTVINLGNADKGSGHDTFLKGIIVQFDLCYPQYFTPQLQRYHWVDIVSSQSKMHKIMSKSLTQEDFTRPLPQIWLEHLNALIEEKRFDELINELPCGYMQWMGISTNYLQLKTIYRQRKNHKLKDDWGYFCKWVEELPLAKELIICEK